jgi:uncharacterized protein (TIGR03083 family)
MPAARSKAEIIAATHDTFDAILALGASLGDGDWKVDSECPGWTVQDCFAHMLGTEQMLMGRQPPEGDIGEPAYIRNDIGKFNEAWVVAYRDKPGAQLLDDLRAVVDERYAALETLGDEEFDEVGFTPAGQDTHGRFLQIRVFDCWIHEQDCRGPLGRPGHASGPAVESALDELTNSMGFVFGKKAGATEGQSLELVLTGETSRTIRVRVEGRAAVVPALDGEPTVRVTIPTLEWFRIAAGRRPGSPADAEIEGDADLGARLVTNAAYTI